MYLSGCGCPEIAKELNHLCVPRENQTGAWYQYGVSYILKTNYGLSLPKQMQEEFGSAPEDLLAGIGPSIGPCCFAVGEDVADKFKQAFPKFADKLISAKEGQLYVNLWEANRLQLMEAGLLAEHIEMADTCTDCQHQWFYSYRADGGQTGRMAAIIALNQY